jgi:hypothetical protein
MLRTAYSSASTHYPSNLRKAFTLLALPLALLCVSAANSASGRFSKSHTLTPPHNVQIVAGQRIAVNDSGQMIAVWQQGTQLQARILTAGIWGSATAITEAGDTAALFDVAEAPADQAVAVFSLTSGGQTSAQYSFYANSAWFAPQAIPATQGATVLNARVGFDGYGNATLLWVEQSGTACAVMTATGDASAGWSAAQHLGDGCYPYIQFSENTAGEAVVGLGAPPVGRHGGSPWVVAGRSKIGEWSSLIYLGTGVYATPPSVAIAENGAALATFSDADLGVQYSRRSRTDGSWSTPDIVYGGVPAVTTAIAMAKNGTAVVAFNSYYTNVPPAALLSSTLPSGSFQWTAPIYVSDSSSTIDNFTVKATKAGTFAVGWSGSVPGETGAAMGASLLPPGVNAWTTKVLDSDRSGNGIYPSPFTTDIAVAKGRAAALWNNYDTRGTAIDRVKVSTAKVK